ncbi:MAG: ThiF family adenylyltransferase [Candidatus Thermoplasmatota archaeon]|jgi:adenylyltransferase/sulfurtransferase|nr:ThiF family adenylyltransferase [Candidatus Thermoplasmatota archaeon]MCL5791154.1 ThiF family adenylyltransferase [Candidatus Thermoplasmatota archaeon]
MVRGGYNDIIAIAGCGGNGQFAAQILSSMGYSLILIDGDDVDETNLHRQPLFSVEDMGRNKAMVCSEKISLLNGTSSATAIGEYVDSYNVESILGDAGLIIDATDSFRTRELINEFSVRHNIPMIFSSSFGSIGQIKCIIPHVTSCLHCLTGEHVLNPLNCHNDGVLPYVPQITSASIAGFADKILKGGEEDGKLYIFNFNGFTMDQFDVKRRPDCSVCGKGIYVYMDDKKFRGRQVL